MPVRYAPISNQEVLTMEEVTPPGHNRPLFAGGTRSARRALCLSSSCLR
jgi:hypothetical protein